MRRCKRLILPLAHGVQWPCIFIHYIVPDGDDDAGYRSCHLRWSTMDRRLQSERMHVHLCELFRIGGWARSLCIQYIPTAYAITDFDA
jgi:hypothetical protein